MRAHEASCPFCSEALPAFVAPRQRSGRGLSRAAVIAGTLAIAGCGGSTPNPSPGPAPTSEPPDDGNMVALYGAPPEPPEDAPDADDGADDDPGTMAPKYGAPPPP